MYAELIKKVKKLLYYLEQEELYGLGVPTIKLAQELREDLQQQGVSGE